MSRRKYSVRLTVNGHHIKAVVIDPHYEIKHSASITDKLIWLIEKDELFIGVVNAYRRR